MPDSLLISRADGGLSIAALTVDSFIPDELAKWESQANANWLPIVSWRVVVDPVFPPRVDRESWVDNGTSIVVDAIRKANLANEELITRRQAAIALATAKEKIAQLIRAELLVTMDELNICRQWITDFKAALAGAGTYAAFKTAVAALPNLPQRTASQIKPALVNRVSTVDAD